MRNPPNDMTSVGGQTDTGFLAAESRISFEALSAQQRRWQISYTMHDGLDVDKRERLENVNFRQFLRLRNLGSLHTFEG